MASGLQQPTSVRVDERYAYWIHQATPTSKGGIARAEIDTGVMEVLTDSLTDPVALAPPRSTNNAWLYFTSGDTSGSATGGLFRIENRVGGQVVPVDAHDFAASSLTLRNGVYYSTHWSAALGAQVRGFDGQGAACTVALRAGASVPLSALSVDDTDVYFAEGGTIFRTPVGCNPQVMVPLGTDSPVRALKASTNDTRDALSWLTPSALVHVKKSDPFGEPPICAPANDPRALAISDASTVYSNAGDGSIRAAIRAGAGYSVHAVACDQGEPTSLAVRESDESLIWSDRAGGRILVLDGMLEWWSR